MQFINSQSSLIIKCILAFATAQGFSWFILAILAVNYYNNVPDLTDNTSEFVWSIYNRYLNSLYQQMYVPDAILTPDGFAALAVFYLLFNLTWWLGGALSLLYLFNGNLRIYQALDLCGFAGLLAAVLDLILSIALIVDYRRNCIGTLSLAEDLICRKGIVPLILIACKIGEIASGPDTDPDKHSDAKYRVRDCSKVPNGALQWLVWME